MGRAAAVVAASSAATPARCGCSTRPSAGRPAGCSASRPWPAWRSSRLKRTDARTGWLIAVGGTFAITAITFSKAQGIFHPYYVSALAPFTALLVGAGAVQIAKGGTLMRVFGPLTIAGGVATELLVIKNSATDMDWMVPVVIAAGVAAVVLAIGLGDRWRAIAVATVLGVLLVAPGAWAVQTLDHATSSTFPAGGPASAGGMGGMGGGPGNGARPPGRGMRGGQGLPGGAPPAAAPGATTGTQTGGPPSAMAGGGGGGMFGGNSQTLTEALAYVKAHGGGTVAVSSQSGASSSLITSGANVAAIGGFSGRESQVTPSWLADRVDAGEIRWVLTDSGGGKMQDSRVGSKDVMTAVQNTCKQVSSVSGLYDCQGSTTALRAAS